MSINTTYLQYASSATYNKIEQQNHQTGGEGLPLGENVVRVTNTSPILGSEPRQKVILREGVDRVKQNGKIIKFLSLIKSTKNDKIVKDKVVSLGESTSNALRDKSKKSKGMDEQLKNTLAGNIFITRRFDGCEKTQDIDRLLSLINNYVASSGEKNDRIKKIRRDLNDSELLGKHFVINGNKIESAATSLKVSARDLILMYYAFAQNHKNGKTFLSNLTATLEYNYNIPPLKRNKYNNMEDLGKESAALCEKLIIKNITKEVFSIKLRELIKAKIIITDEIFDYFFDIERPSAAKFPNVKWMRNKNDEFKKIETDIDYYIEKMPNLGYLDKVKKEFINNMMLIINENVANNVINDKVRYSTFTEGASLANFQRDDESLINHKIESMYGEVQKQLTLSAVNYISSSDAKVIKDICTKLIGVKVYDVKQSPLKNLKNGEGRWTACGNLQQLGRWIEKVLKNVDERKVKLYQLNDEMNNLTSKEINDIKKVIDEDAIGKSNMFFSAAVEALKNNQNEFKGKKVKEFIDNVSHTKELKTDAQKGTYLLDLMKNHTSELTEFKAVGEKIKQVKAKYNISIGTDLNIISADINSNKINEEVVELIDRACKALPKPKSTWQYIKEYFSENKLKLGLKIGIPHIFGGVMQLVGKFTKSTTVNAVGYVSHGVGSFHAIKSLYDGWCYARNERRVLKNAFDEFTSLRTHWEDMKP